MVCVLGIGIATTLTMLVVMRLQKINSAHENTDYRDNVALRNKNMHFEHLWGNVSRRPLFWLMVAMVWLGTAAVFRPLTLPDEGRYVGVAWEMFSSGHWAVPTLDGLPYFHKPPLFYWLTAGSFTLFGPHLLSARLASLCAAVLMCVALFRLLSRTLDGKTARIAVVILLTQPFFYASAQFANMDMLVASMITLCLLSAAEFVWALEQGQSGRQALLMSMLFAALGVLAKGLIGVVLPGAVVMVWLTCTGRLAHLKRFFWLPALALFVLVVSPWFLWMAHGFKGFLQYFFIHHHFQRFTGHLFNNRQPFWFYPVALIVLTLPSSLWVLRAKKSVVLGWSAKQRDVAGLMLSWLLVILLFFSIPVSKPLGYIMPVLPALATLIALCIRTAEASTRRWQQLTFGSAVLACVIAMTVLVQHAIHSASYQLAQQVSSQVKSDDQLVMLGKYQFDLPFYLQLSAPAWVVADWPAIQQHLTGDSWERELIEAIPFDRHAATGHLLSEAQLNHQRCQLAPSQVLWVVGDADVAKHINWLKNRTPVAQVRNHLLWRVDAAQRELDCRATAH